MAPIKLFVVYSKKDEVLDEEVEWRDTVGHQQRCSTCARPRQGLFPAPLVAEVIHRRRATISLSGMSGIRIYAREFFDRLHSRFDGIVPGPVTRPGGRLQLESVTAHFDPLREVPLRGGHRTAYRRCPTCGRVSIQNPWQVKPWNVLARSLPDAGGIYHIAIRGLLLLSDQAITGMALQDFEDLKYEQVLVLDEPIETVPELGDAPVPGEPT